MANEVHVRVLLSGREQWEFARKERPGTVPDLSGADLGGANLRDFDLTGANLKGANLSGADLGNAGLWTLTILPRVEFDLLAPPPRQVSVEADLSGANLSGANLNGAVRGANFSGCDLRGADLSTVTGLTAEQIAVAVVDETTKLPLYLNF